MGRPGSAAARVLRPPRTGPLPLPVFHPALVLTALPLRVTPEGRLARQEPFEAIVALIGVMAGTSSRAWPHAPWFGLYEAFLEAARRDRQDHEGLKDAVNRALRELGVDDYRVLALSTGPLAHDGRREFRLTIEDPDGRALFSGISAG